MIPVLNGSLNSSQIFHRADCNYNDRYKRNLNEEELYELNPNNRTKISSRRLILNDTTRDDVGDYVCRTYNEQAPNNIEEALIHVRLDHLVAISGVEISHSDNTSVVYEGQRVELFCGPVNGDLQVTSYWRSSPSADPFAGGSQMIQELGSEPRIGEKRPSLYAIKVENYGKKLIIDPIGMEHRQYYVCSVQNPIATIHRKQIFLRVHGRLVALWPALGITVEIFVFLLILYCTTIRSAVKIKTKEAVNNCKCIAKLPVNPREKANGDITNQLLLSNRV